MDLSALDRECLLAMGCHPVSDESGIWTHWPGLIPEARIETPSPTRNWSDFGTLLLWAAGKGMEPEVAARLQDESVIDKDRWWSATIWIGPGHFLTQNASDPRVALALAISEWRKGR